MTRPPTRRAFLAGGAAAAAASAVSLSLDHAAAREAAKPADGPAEKPAPAKRKARVLLRSSWQTVNIGDIAHTPGVLALIERHLPGVEVRLWPSSVGNGVEEMLRKRFPGLVIARGPDLKAALEECDFLLHGSGPSLVAAKDVERWRKETGKPYGIYGITFSAGDPQTLELLDGAKFAFFRDSASLKFARAKSKCPVMDFGPDGAFAVDLRADDAAGRFLKDAGLEEGRFLCCIPRLRNTPYWAIHGRKMTPEDERRHAVNEAKKEQDHAPLRAAIEAVVRKTGLKVLVCPEDESQMAVGKAMLVDPLPEEVRKSVVWREKFWLTDEALSVYVRSAGLFGNEMHSPIMCIGNGVPAVVCRWAEQTTKGLMWRDIGLGDWLFDMDSAEERARVPAAVLAIASDPAAAKARVAEAQKVVRQRQAETMKVLGEHLPA